MILNIEWRDASNTLISFESHTVADASTPVDELVELRVLAATEAGDSPGALSSMLKTRGSEVKQRITELAAQAVAHYALPFQPQALNPFGADRPVGPCHAVTAMPTYLNERAATIYSGASEVQRDVLAKRVLGL